MEKIIDLEAVLKEKAPKIAPFVPRAVLKRIKKILHEDDINDFMNRSKDKYGEDFINVAMDEIEPDLSYQGLDNIPSEGGAIIAANHPLGGPDGIALLHTIMRKRKDAYFLVNDVLMQFENFGDHFVPVNKFGKNSSEYSERFEQVFSSEHIVILFPAGLVSRKIDGKIQDKMWKKGFITRSVRYRKNVVPTYIDARLSDRFYRWSSFREKLGIKLNFEQFLLPDEMYKQNGKPMIITFGPIVDYQIFDFKIRSAEKWTEIFRNYVYTLSEYPNREFESYLKENNY